MPRESCDHRSTLKGLFNGREGPSVHSRESGEMWREKVAARYVEELEKCQPLARKRYRYLEMQPIEEFLAPNQFSNCTETFEAVQERFHREWNSIKEQAVVPLTAPPVNSSGVSQLFYYLDPTATPLSPR